MIKLTVMFRDRSTEVIECKDYAQMLAVIEALGDQGPWEIYIEVPYAVG